MTPVRTKWPVEKTSGHFLLTRVNESKEYEGFRSQASLQE